MTRPSTQMMQSLNLMIAPYGVRYYSKNGCTPGFCNDPNDVDSIEDYFRHYGLKYNGIEFSNQEKCVLAKHFWDDYRTLFGREYDRIICTNSFRRLQYKTQVMVNSASDEQRTRLLHSLEVQRIARRIALAIGANAELAENIAVAHDIGHAPFGHSGEDAISEFLTPKTNNGKPADQDAHFLHAMQSVKVLDKIATHTYLQEHGIAGLGLSDYVLEGVLKHDADVFSEEIVTGHVKNQYDVSRLCGLVGIDDYNSAITKYLGECRDTLFPQVLIGSVESQIVAWADKIAYLGHDWEEFLDTRLLEKMISRINDMVSDICAVNSNEQQGNASDELSKLHEIKKSLKKIEVEYSSSKEAHVVWKSSVCGELIEIIKNISEIESIRKDTLLFTAKEYRALKDYFAMVISWVTLTDEYPQPYAMKCDPMYIFYMYLCGIRTTIITKAVTDKLISGTQATLKFCQDRQELKTREDYLGYCNSKWIKTYQKICKGISDVKLRKKTIKNNVRDCYLVRFERNGYEYNTDKLISIEDHGYFDFSDTYCCLLNIISCIGTQYIGSTRVNFMTQQAKKIVTGLMTYYVAHPDMLPYSQRRRYKKNLSSRDDDLLYFIADYVGGMTDRMAKKKYDEIVSSDTKWSNEYSSGLT